MLNMVFLASIILNFFSIPLGTPLFPGSGNGSFDTKIKNMLIPGMSQLAMFLTGTVIFRAFMNLF